MATVGAWYGLVDHNPGARRARELAASREQLRAGLAGVRKRTSSRQVSIGLMKQVVGRISVRRTQQADRLARTLAQAGFRNKDAIVAYQFAKIVRPIALGLGAVRALLWPRALQPQRARARAAPAWARSASATCCPTST